MAKKDSSVIPSDLKSSTATLHNKKSIQEKELLCLPSFCHNFIHLCMATAWLPIPCIHTCSVLNYYWQSYYDVMTNIPDFNGQGSMIVTALNHCIVQRKQRSIGLISIISVCFYPFQMLSSPLKMNCFIIISNSFETIVEMYVVFAFFCICHKYYGML